MDENTDNMKLIEKFCIALNEFGSEEKRRDKYKEVYNNFNSVTDIRQIYNDFIRNAVKSHSKISLDSIIRKNRDIILDFINNANKVSPDESFE